jgi:hypothetical protein
VCFDLPTLKFGQGKNVEVVLTMEREMLGLGCPGKSEFIGLRQPVCPKRPWKFLLHFLIFNLLTYISCISGFHFDIYICAYNIS